MFWAKTFGAISGIMIVTGFGYCCWGASVWGEAFWLLFDCFFVRLGCCSLVLLFAWVCVRLGFCSLGSNSATVPRYEGSKLFMVCFVLFEFVFINPCPVAASTFFCLFRIEGRAGTKMISGQGLINTKSNKTKHTKTNQDEEIIIIQQPINYNNSFIAIFVVTCNGTQRCIAFSL